MPAFWFTLKKSWQCKSQSSSDVHDPAVINMGGNYCQTQARKSCGFRCSRSVSNIIHGGSKRYSTEKPVICSPRSLASCDLVSPITHQVVVNDSKWELKIGNFGDQRSVSGFSSAFLGALRPGTPRLEMVSGCTPRRSNSLPRKIIHGRYSDVSGSRNCTSVNSPRPRISVDAKFDDTSAVTCKKCFNKFKNLDGVKEHNLSNHAVTELKEGDSSREIVEIICKTSWPKSKQTNFLQIQKVLKIHNKQSTISEFEKHRETVKIKASKLQTKHPRCLADGNELLRFHGTNIACSFGVNGDFVLCKLNHCGVCGILRNGFSESQVKVGEIGVFTASSGGRAMEKVSESKGKKGLIICRVIAGRVHKPVENNQEFAGKFGFDSLAAKIGQLSNIEELYLLNPKALLPCFVVL